MAEHFIVVWLGLSLLESLCFSTVNFTHASQSIFLPLGGTGCQEWAKVVYFLSLMWKA